MYRGKKIDMGTNNSNNNKINNNNEKMMRRGRVSSGLDPFGCVMLGCSIVFTMCLIGLPSHVQATGENPEPVGICAMLGCNCTIIAHHWINVKCVFSDDQDVQLHDGAVPADALEVEVSHCRELRILSGAFTGGEQLKRVHVTGIHSLVAKRQAFHNISGPNPLLEVSECNRVVLESHAFKNARGTLSVTISRCKHVEIKPNAFSWLLKISIKDVMNLDLSSNAFKFEAPPHGRHGPATKIMFQSVKIPELPSSVFPSAAAEVQMDDMWTRVIRKDAFCPMSILSVTISNASIFEIESGAFSDRTLISNLELVDVKVRIMRTGAFQAAFNNLTIQYSRLNEIEAGAIDASVATVTFNNNEFHNLKTNSIVLRQWNRIAIDHNLFVVLERDAISAGAVAKGTTNLEFSFTGNRVTKAGPGSLNIASVSQRVNSAHVGNNYFEETCSCLLDDWMREITGSNTSTAWMMDSSYCVAGEWLERCFKIPQGYLSMRNYTRIICTPDGNITCKEPSSKPQPSASPPSVGPHIYPRQNSYFDVEMSDTEQLEREKRIIVVICVAAVFAIVAIILTSGVVYMRRRGVCPKLTSGPLMNLASSWLSPSSGMTAATSARSISRMSVHEYAGLRPETRVLEIEPTEIEGTEEDITNAEDYAYTENKATQTLPEELTEEYLRDLRERLNDPDNYSQARDMIEHLYDLIKVEESCNNNNNNDQTPVSNRQDENAYDVIGPRTRRPRGAVKASVNVGTRVPSLERLLPTDVRARPPIAEYTEPRDQRTNDQNHLYAELPGDETVPSTSRLSQPILASLAGRAPLPLPPDVVNDHLINNDNPNDRKYADPDRGNSEYADLKLDDPIASRLRDDSNPHNKGRPLSFLKALGESILGATKITNKRPVNPSLLCEYADPTDATSHVYSELPESHQTNSSPCQQISKMANRPLPTKPDQDTNVNDVSLTRT